MKNQMEFAIWVFPKIGRKSPKWMVCNYKMDDLGVPLFSETSIWIRLWMGFLDGFFFLQICASYFLIMRCKLETNF